MATCRLLELTHFLLALLYAPQITYGTNPYTTQLALLMQYLKWDKVIVVGTSMVSS